MLIYMNTNAPGLWPAPNTYQPSDAALASLHDVTLAAVVGVSAAGKTTLIEQLCAADSSVHMLVGTTTRVPRPQEIPERDYHFLSVEQAQASVRAGDFLTITPSPNGDLYATSPDAYAHNGLTIMALWASGVPLFRALPFAAMRVVVVVPPSFEEWQRRLNLHDLTDEQHAARMSEARESLAFAAGDSTAICIMNDDLARVTPLFRAAVFGESNDLLARETERARLAARAILRQI